jgi:hypothetical protein
MIIVESDKKPQLIGTAYDNYTAPKFRVFYRSAPLTITGPAGETGYTGLVSDPDFSNLTSDTYNEFVKWSTNDITLECSFAEQKIDSILLGNPSFDEAQINVYLGSDIVMSSRHPHWVVSQNFWVLGQHTSPTIGLVFDRGDDSYIQLKRETAPGYKTLDKTDQKIIPFVLQGRTADRVEIKLRGGATEGSLNKIWIGQRDEWIAGSAASYPMNIKGTGGVTDVGTVYGTILPSLRQFSYSWDYIDDVVRRQMEDYMDTVQLSTPHYILPFVDDQQFIPCMFVRLSTDTAKNERHISGWYWQSPKFDYDILR